MKNGFDNNKYIKIQSKKIRLEVNMLELMTMNY